jgi:capsular polysaccharide transport system permease protein
MLMAAPPRIARPAGDRVARPLPPPGRGPLAAFRPHLLVAPRPDQAAPRRPPLALLSFILVVVLPAAIAGLYYFLIAADQYVVEFRFGLRSVAPARNAAAVLLQQSLANSQAGLDSYAIVQYAESRAVIDDLDRRLDLRAMFTRPESDWPARLHVPASIEQLVRYWRHQVDAFYDASDGTITIRTRAFRPGDAFVLAQAIAASCERLVNSLSARARQDALRNSKDEVARSETRLEAALARLRVFRDQEGIIDPHKNAASSLALSSRLHDELVHSEAELSALQTYLHGDAPSVRLLEAKIRSLAARQHAVAGAVTTGDTPAAPGLSRLISTYDELAAERNFAEIAYNHALAALDRARENANRQQVYLAVFVAPSLPEEALYPHRLRNVAIVLLVAFAVWGIGSLLVHSIQDHL